MSDLVLNFLKICGIGLFRNSQIIRTNQTGQKSTPRPSFRLVGSHPTKKDPCGSKNSEKVNVN